MAHKYLELDGLRGVAAISVVLMHSADLFGTTYSALLRRSEYLAVDFFLLLSGFVIAHAYEGRLRQPGNIAGFFRDRAIRLYPLLALGAVAGAIGIAIHPDPLDPAPNAAKLLWRTAAGALAVPVPGSMWAFPVNFPTWSLFWEIILNIAYALTAPALTNTRVLIAFGLSLLLTVAIGLVHGAIDFAPTFKGVIASGPRMTASFLLGIAVFRFRAADVFAGSKRRWWPVLLLLTALLIVPAEGAMRLPCSLGAVLIVFPIVLLAAADSRPLVTRLATFSGSISYPVYILHIPITHVALWMANKVPIGPGPLLGAFVLANVLAFSYVALILYDQPVRNRLRQRFGSRRHREPNELTQA